MEDRNIKEEKGFEEKVPLLWGLSVSLVTGECQIVILLMVMPSSNEEEEGGNKIRKRNNCERKEKVENDILCSFPKDVVVKMISSFLFFGVYYIILLD